MKTAAVRYFYGLLTGFSIPASCIVERHVGLFPAGISGDQQRYQQNWRMSPYGAASRWSIVLMLCAVLSGEI
jgi:hypothetical protein